MNFAQALAAEIATQQDLSNCRHKASGQGAPAPKTCAKVTQGKWGEAASKTGTCQRVESQGKRTGRAFFEARQINFGAYARGFPLRSLILKGLAHELGENLGDVIYLERDVRRGKMSIAVARPSPPPIRVSQPRETSIMAEVLHAPPE